MDAEPVASEEVLAIATGVIVPQPPNPVHNVLVSAVSQMLQVEIHS